jgi:hypothetical protein
LAVALCALLPSAARADDFDQEPICYSSATPDNAVSRLQQRLAAGAAVLQREDGLGYLRDLLRELKVPVSSQMLVFSKTSLQRHRISPRTPRAVYFSDEVSVGFCQKGDVLEVAAADPKLGLVFYTVDQYAKAPRFERQTETCLLCHGSSATRGMPGLLLRSVYPDRDGLPVLSLGSHRINHGSPFAERWGGWYVTGTHGDQQHLGNLIVPARGARLPADNRAGMNLTSLKGRIDTGAYLSGHSDIVALMVLEHQAEAQNLLVQANFLTRQALFAEAALNRELKQPPGERWESTTRRIKAAGEPLVQYLLFSGEAPLAAEVHGTSGFAEEFAQAGPRDRRGRSLHDLDLKRRLFRYPCSHLIYSQSFDALPAEVKDHVWRRIWEVLTGRDNGKEFAHLSPADRQAIREILLDTKPDLPPYWREAGRAP